ncbi:MAG: hypothetical protein K5754_02350 [Butyrivibrio sp.]|jgi:hypothetical protein|nr:hypothetical protein [Butyrivibrio sp.]MCR4635046.1 hypothetical protein [Butyrivibrio sp.]
MHNRLVCVGVLCSFLLTACGSTANSVENSTDATYIEKEQKYDKATISPTDNMDIDSEDSNAEPDTSTESNFHDPIIDEDNAPLADPIVETIHINGYILEITTKGYIFRNDPEVDDNSRSDFIVGEIIQPGEYEVRAIEYGSLLLHITEGAKMYSYYMAPTNDLYDLIYSLYSDVEYTEGDELDQEIIKKANKDEADSSEYGYYHYYGYVHEDGAVTEMTINDDGTVIGPDEGQTIYVTLNIGATFYGMGIELIPTNLTSDMLEESSEAAHKLLAGEQLDTESAIAAASAANEDPRDPQFRGFRWGDSKDFVKTNETAEFLIELDNGSLCYKYMLNGHSVKILYEFDENDELFCAMYMLDEQYYAGGRYIEILNDWKRELVDKYGEPNSVLDENGIIYYEDKSFIDTIGEESALMMGYISYYYGWEVGNKSLFSEKGMTHIGLKAITGSDGVVYVAIVYKEDSAWITGDTVDDTGQSDDF